MPSSAAALQAAVSQSLTLPRAKPRVNQDTRSAQEPGGNDYGTM